MEEELESLGESGSSSRRARRRRLDWTRSGWIDSRSTAPGVEEADEGQAGMGDGVRAWMRFGLQLGAAPMKRRGARQRRCKGRRLSLFDPYLSRQFSLLRTPQLLEQYSLHAPQMYRA